MVWGAIAIVLLAGYLLGSMPTGYIIARLVKGIDIRDHGSGNPGATNVFRTVGKGAGIAVLLVDLLKGVAAVRLAGPLLHGLGGGLGLSSSGTALSGTAVAWVVTLAGLCALLGHSRSIWLKFTGGKSAATGLGVLLALAWPVGLGAAFVFALTFAVFRIVSLGSILAALAAPAIMVVLQQPLPFCLLAVAGGGYVVLRHRSNIGRLLAGTEPRLQAADK
ncbi:MAG: glycerol-3-phosphate 1-O-acyltransferase PlsY [Cyanobacteria bacterium P01_A01_bin.105]